MSASSDPLVANAINEESSKTPIEVFLENAMQIGYFLAVIALGYIVFQIITSEDLEDIKNAVGNVVGGAVGFASFWLNNPWLFLLIPFIKPLGEVLLESVRNFGSPMRYLSLKGAKRIMFNTALVKRMEALRLQYNSLLAELKPEEKEVIDKSRTAQYESRVSSDAKNIRKKVTNGKTYSEAMSELSDASIEDIRRRGRSAFDPLTQSGAEYLQKYQILQARTTIEAARFAKLRLADGDAVDMKGLEAMLMCGEMGGLAASDKAKLDIDMSEMAEMADFADKYIRMSNKWTALALEKKMPPMNHNEMLRALKPSGVDTASNFKKMSESLDVLDETIDKAVGNWSGVGGDIDNTLSASNFFEKHFKGKWTGDVDPSVFKKAFSGKKGGFFSNKIKKDFNLLDIKIKF